MNKIFKLKFNHHTGTYAAVSELTRTGRIKTAVIGSLALIASIVIQLDGVSIAQAAPAYNTAPYPYGSISKGSWAENCSGNGQGGCTGWGRQGDWEGNPMTYTPVWLFFERWRWMPWKAPSPMGSGADNPNWNFNQWGFPNDYGPTWFVAAGANNNVYTSDHSTLFAGATAGFDNVFSGNYATILGQANRVGDNSVAVGTNNVSMMVDHTGQILGTSDFLSNQLVIGSNNALIGDAGFVLGDSHTMGSNNSVTIGWHSTLAGQSSLQTGDKPTPDSARTHSTYNIAYGSFIYGGNDATNMIYFGHNIVEGGAYVDNSLSPSFTPIYYDAQGVPHQSYFNGQGGQNSFLIGNDLSNIPGGSTNSVYLGNNITAINGIRQGSPLNTVVIGNDLQLTSGLNVFSMTYLGSYSNFEPIDRRDPKKFWSLQYYPVANQPLWGTTYSWGLDTSQAPGAYGLLELRGYSNNKKLLTRIMGVAPGLIGPHSRDLINGAQLYALIQPIALANGGAVANTNASVVFQDNGLPGQADQLAWHHGTRIGMAASDNLLLGLQPQNNQSKVVLGHVATPTLQTLTVRPQGSFTDTDPTRRVTASSFTITPSAGTSFSLTDNGSSLALTDTPLNPTLQNAVLWGAQAQAAHNAVAVGEGAQATGTNALAVGHHSRASLENAVAVGHGAQATHTHTMVIGDMSADAPTLSTQNTLVGSRITGTAGEHTTVLGSQISLTSETQAVIIGSGSQIIADQTRSAGTTEVSGSTPVGVVALGSNTMLRRVQNVAPGVISETSTDAINGSQLANALQALANQNTAWNIEQNKVRTAVSGTKPLFIGRNLVLEALPNQAGASLTLNPTLTFGDTTQTSTVISPAGLTLTRTGVPSWTLSPHNGTLSFDKATDQGTHLESLSSSADSLSIGTLHTTAEAVTVDNRIVVNPNLISLGANAPMTGSGISLGGEGTIPANTLLLGVGTVGVTTNTAGTGAVSTTPVTLTAKTSLTPSLTTNPDSVRAVSMATRTGLRRVQAVQNGSAPTDAVTGQQLHTMVKDVGTAINPKLTQLETSGDALLPSFLVSDGEHTTTLMNGNTLAVTGTAGLSTTAAGTAATPTLDIAMDGQQSKEKVIWSQGNKAFTMDAEQGALRLSGPWMTQTGQNTLTTTTDGVTLTTGTATSTFSSDGFTMGTQSFTAGQLITPKVTVGSHTLEENKLTVGNSVVTPSRLNLMGNVGLEATGSTWAFHAKNVTFNPVSPEPTLSAAVSRGMNANMTGWSWAGETANAIAGTEPTGLVRSHGMRWQHVAPGLITATSQDAITGGQLYQSFDALNKAYGSGTAIPVTINNTPVTLTDQTGLRVTTDSNLSVNSSQDNAGNMTVTMGLVNAPSFEHVNLGSAATGLTVNQDGHLRIDGMGLTVADSASLIVGNAQTHTQFDKDGLAFKNGTYHATLAANTQNGKSVVSFGLQNGQSLRLMNASVVPAGATSAGASAAGALVAAGHIVTEVGTGTENSDLATMAMLNALQTRSQEGMASLTLQTVSTSVALSPTKRTITIESNTNPLAITMAAGQAQPTLNLALQNVNVNTLTLSKDGQSATLSLQDGTLTSSLPLAVGNTQMTASGFVTPQIQATDGTQVTTLTSGKLIATDGTQTLSLTPEAVSSSAGNTLSSTADTVTMTTTNANPLNANIIILGPKASAVEDFVQSLTKRQEGALIVGTQDAPVVIHNVPDGTQSHDLINLKQLQETVFTAKIKVPPTIQVSVGSDNAVLTNTLGLKLAVGPNLVSHFEAASDEHPINTATVGLAPIVTLTHDADSLNIQGQGLTMGPTQVQATTLSTPSVSVHGTTGQVTVNQEGLSLTPTGSPTTSVIGLTQHGITLASPAIHVNSNSIGIGATPTGPGIFMNQGTVLGVKPGQLDANSTDAVTVGQLTQFTQGYTLKTESNPTGVTINHETKKLTVTGKKGLSATIGGAEHEPTLDVTMGNLDTLGVGSNASGQPEATISATDDGKLSISKPWGVNDPKTGSTRIDGDTISITKPGETQPATSITSGGMTAGATTVKPGEMTIGTAPNQNTVTPTGISTSKTIIGDPQGIHATIDQNGLTFSPDATKTSGGLGPNGLTLGKSHITSSHGTTTWQTGEQPNTGTATINSPGLVITSPGAMPSPVPAHTFDLGERQAQNVGNGLIGPKSADMVNVGQVIGVAQKLLKDMKDNGAAINWTLDGTTPQTVTLTNTQGMSVVLQNTLTGTMTPATDDAPNVMTLTIPESLTYHGWTINQNQMASSLWALSAQGLSDTQNQALTTAGWTGKGLTVSATSATPAATDTRITPSSLTLAGMTLTSTHLNVGADSLKTDKTLTVGTSTMTPDAITASGALTFSAPTIIIGDAAVPTEALPSTSKDGSTVVGRVVMSGQRVTQVNAATQATQAINYGQLKSLAKNVAANATNIPLIVLAPDDTPTQGRLVNATGLTVTKGPNLSASLATVDDRPTLAWGVGPSIVLGNTTVNAQGLSMIQDTRTTTVASTGVNLSDSLRVESADHQTSTTLTGEHLTVSDGTNTLTLNDSSLAWQKGPRLGWTDTGWQIAAPIVVFGDASTPVPAGSNKVIAFNNRTLAGLQTSQDDNALVTGAALMALREQLGLNSNQTLGTQNHVAGRDNHIGEPGAPSSQNTVTGAKNTITNGKSTDPGHNDVLGSNNTLSGGHSTLTGAHNASTGDHNSIVGTHNAIQGSDTQVVGTGLTVGDAEHPSQGTTAIGSASQVVGDHNQAVGTDQHVSGDRNSTVGAHQTVTGHDNVTQGHDQTISGDHNVALGDTQTVDGNSNIALGTGTSVKKLDDQPAHGNIVVGTGASATGSDNVVLGPHASSSGTQNVALGAGSVAQDENGTPTVSVGSDQGTRVITHVAAGTNPDDLVNKKQAEDTILNNAHVAIAVEAAGGTATTTPPGDVAVSHNHGWTWSGSNNIDVTLSKANQTDAPIVTIGLKEDLTLQEALTVQKGDESTTINAAGVHITSGTGADQKTASVTVTPNSIALTAPSGVTFAPTADALPDPVNPNAVDLGGRVLTGLAPVTNSSPDDQLATGGAMADLLKTSGMGQNKTQGEGNLVRGKDNTTTGAHNLVMGQDNQIGIPGTDKTLPANTNTVMGSHNQVQGPDNQVFGSGNTITGPDAEHPGARNLISGSNSHIQGSDNVVVGSHSHVTGDNNVAYGTGSSVTGSNSVALGAGSIVQASQGIPTVSVGADHATRVVTNVAPGQRPTDAVTVKQLNDYLKQFDHALGDDARRFTREARGGLASATAMASLPLRRVPGKKSAAVAVGSYKDAVAISLGMSYTLINGKAMLRVSGASSNMGDVQIGGSVGILW